MAGTGMSAVQQLTWPPNRRVARRWRSLRTCSQRARPIRCCAGYHF